MGAGQTAAGLHVQLQLTRLCRDCVSSETTTCVSWSTGRSLELLVPEQESMDLSRRAGRTGWPGMSSARTSRGQQGTAPSPPLWVWVSVLLGSPDPLWGPDSLCILFEDRNQSRGTTITGPSHPPLCRVLSAGLGGAVGSVRPRAGLRDNPVGAWSGVRKVHGGPERAPSREWCGPRRREGSIQAWRTVWAKV